MTDTRTDLPDPKSPNFLRRVREVLQTYMGRQGDGLDRGLTVGDMVDAGLAEVRPGHKLRPGGSIPLVPGTGVQAAYEADLTPPPTPTGFVATAAISSLLVEHDAPVYTAGHGHLRTRLFGATWVSGPLPVFADAVEIAQFTGTVHAYATNPATTWHLWAKWESRDGVLSAAPAGGTNGFVVTTGQDVAKLLEALTGEITESQLFASLGARIDLLDAGGVDATQLPYSLVALAASQDALNQRVAHDLDSIGTDLLANAASINNTAGLVTAAGVYVEPGTGQVKISGLEATNSTLSAVDARLSAAETSITLKATRTYVDNLVATAVIDPSQIPVFTTLEARVTSAEVDIDGLNAAVGLKASTLSLDATNVRMTTAETNISALTGTVSTKVDSSTFTATTGGLDARLGSAESTLTSLGDVSAITQVVQQSNRRHVQDNQDGETLLRSVLNTQQETELRAQEVALARSDLTATIEEGLSAEASARLLLAAQVDTNTAAIQTESTTRANQDASLASQITTLQAVVDGNVAAIQTESMARADADSAAASQIDTLQATVTSNNTTLTAAIVTESTARANETGALYAQYTVKTDVAGLVSGYDLASTASNAAPTSAFGVRANAFFVAPPATASATAPTDDLFDGYTWLDTSVTPNVTRYRSGEVWVTTPPVLPFIVQATPTTVNGVAVPAGVYMRAAFIQDGTISNAKIGNLAVDDAKISSMSVDKLTAGSIDVGQFIRSTGYLPGEYGWCIDGYGNAELSNAVVRGTVFANAGQIGGNVIDATGMQSPNYAAGDIGWRLDTGGLLMAFGASGQRVLNLAATGTDSVLKIGSALDIKASGAATFSGTLSATNGVFSGSLSGSDISGATGTFSGLLTADTLGSVAVTPIVVDAGTWVPITVPALCNAVRLTLTGAGGGGGGAYWYDTPRGYGSPGAPGALTQQSITGLTPGQTLYVTIGVAGTGGNSAVYAAPTLWWQLNPAGNYQIHATAGGATVVAGYAMAAGGGAGGFNATGSNGWGGSAAAGVSGGLGYGRGGDGYHWQTGLAGMGSSGANGRAILEFYNANGVVTQSEFVAFKALLGY